MIGTQYSNDAVGYGGIGGGIAGVKFLSFIAPPPKHTHPIPLGLGLEKKIFKIYVRLSAMYVLITKQCHNSLDAANATKNVLKICMNLLQRGRTRFICIMMRCKRFEFTL